ncbi:hypothetical protein ACSTHL_23625, partial [Vibrio parahaemolyticus]
FDLDDALYLKLIGITIADAELVLVEAFGPKFGRDDFRGRAAVLYEEIHLKEGLPLKTGIRELLEWARENSVPCAVGTSTVTAEAKKRLET